MDCASRLPCAVSGLTFLTRFRVQYHPPFRMHRRSTAEFRGIRSPHSSTPPIAAPRRPPELRCIPENATLINPPNRNTNFPPVYRLPAAHPLRNPALTAKRCVNADASGFRDFVIIVDLTPKALDAWHNFAETLHVPDLNADDCISKLGMS